VAHRQCYKLYKYWQIPGKVMDVCGARKDRALASLFRSGGFIVSIGTLGLLISACSGSETDTSAGASTSVVAAEQDTSAEVSTSVVAAEQNIEIGDYSEEEYLQDTRVDVWDFDKTGEIRIDGGQSVCETLEKNGWVSSDPEAVTLMFAEMSMRHLTGQIIADEDWGDLPQVDGLEKSRYLVKYATKAYCPELYRDEIPSLEDVLARAQESDESVSRMMDTMRSKAADK